MEKVRVYMDYAATTPVDPRVLETMKPYFLKKFGNSMSLHRFGQEAKRTLEESRGTIAKFINADSNELVFTGGATESNNLALKGVMLANRQRGKHLIVSSIEHPSVMKTADFLQKEGFDVTHLPVDKYGMVEPEKVEEAIREDTVLVSVMHANNEIGTVEPVEKIGKICRGHDVYFHTDATQSFGKIPIDVKKMNIDLLSMSAHKIYGPKGIGGLYVKKGVRIEPLLHGGGQEFGLRSSTANVPGIAGFGATTEFREKEMNQERERLTKLRDRLIAGILKIENSHLNGHRTLRLPNNSNFWFSFVEGESMIAYLSMKEIAASTGSACSSESLEPSHVLLAIGLKHEEAHGSLRLSLGKWSKKEEINYVLEVLPDVIERLREISPFKGVWK